MTKRLERKQRESYTGEKLKKSLEVLYQNREQDDGISRTTLMNLANISDRDSLASYIKTLELLNAIEYKDKKPRDIYKRISISEIGLAMLTGEYIENHIKKTFTTKEISNKLYQIQNYLDGLQNIGIIEKPILNKANKIIDGISENTGKFGIHEVVIAGLRELKEILVQIVKIQKLPALEEYNRFLEIVDDLIDFYRQKIPKPKRESTIHPQRTSILPASDKPFPVSHKPKRK